MEFLSINELAVRSGLRIVIVRDLPSPWGQAAKAMIEYKRLEYTIGLQNPAQPNDDLERWAGTNSAPVVAWENERPLNQWLDILNLLERLAPEQPLLPEDRSARSEVIGLANEICGELGLGWNRRLSLYRPAFEKGDVPERTAYMASKYGYSSEAAEDAVKHQSAGLTLLARRLDMQAKRSSPYLVGNEVTAADFYWAAFSNLFDLPESDLLPLKPSLRPIFNAIEPDVSAALKPILLEHRDFILARYFRSPMEF